MKKVDSKQQTVNAFHVCYILFTVCCLLFAVYSLLSTAVAQEPYERKGQEPEKPKGPVNRLRIANRLDLGREMEKLTRLESESGTSLRELIELYDKLLEASADKLVKRSDGVFVGARQLLQERMVKLSAPAREMYRIMHDGAAGRAYRTAAAPRDDAALAAVVAGYPLSSYTDDALSLLSALQAERGDFESALISLKKLLSWCPDTDLDRERIMARAAWYSYYAGVPGQAWSYLKRLRADDSIERRDVMRLHLAQLEHLLGSTLRQRPSSGRRHRVHGIPGGGFDRAGGSDRVVVPEAICWQRPFHDASGASRVVVTPSRRRIIGRGRIDRQRALAPGAADYRYQSVVYDGKVYAGTEVGVSVFDLKTGKMVMALRAPGGGESFPGLDSSLAPTVTRDYVYANFVYKVSRSENYSHIIVKAAVPQYTLCAFDRRTGKLKWAIHEGKEFKKHFDGKRWSCGSAPVILKGPAGETLYVEVKTRTNLVGSHMAAFDAQTGRMKWVRPLCSNGTELTMFGYDARGPLSSAPAAAGGAQPTVYCCTNLGAVFALDARDGSVRWASSYEEIPLRAARGYYPQMRSIVWANSPPLVSDGVLVVAPLDSQNLYAFDASTGKTLWRLGCELVHPTSGRSRMRYVLGAAGGSVIVSGDRVAAIDLRSGKLKWLAPTRGHISDRGRGVVSRSEVVVPCADGIRWFSLNSGKELRRHPWSYPRSPGMAVEPGNLLTADARVVVTGTTRLTVLGSQR